MCGRVTGFLGTLYREHSVPKTDNVLIVSHGLTMRLFLMRWFRWTVEMCVPLPRPPPPDAAPGSPLCSTRKAPRFGAIAGHKCM